MAERNPPAWMEEGTHSAESDRLFIGTLVKDEGVANADALKVTHVSGMDVSVAAGGAFVKGTSSVVQGTYAIYADTAETFTAPAADGSNPRLDILVAEVLDEIYIGGTDNLWRLRYIAGTPAASPVAPALPANSLKLATISVPATDTNLSGQITDERKLATLSSGVHRSALAVPPTSPTPGDVWIPANDAFMRVYSGSAWRLAAGVVGKRLHLRHELANNTAGGTFTGGAWQTHPLNVEALDEIGSTLAANQFTLPAGTYDVEAYAIANYVNSHKAKLRNVTDGTDTIIGSNAWSQSGLASYTFDRSTVRGRFTIAGTKTFELQHRCLTTRATDGWGAASNYGVVEVYAEVLITQVA